MITEITVKRGIERLHRIINLKHHQYATTRSWERRILDEHRMGAYPGVANSRETSKKYRKRVYSDATQQIKREAARVLDEINVEKKRRPVVGVGVGVGAGVGSVSTLMMNKRRERRRSAKRNQMRKCRS